MTETASKRNVQLKMLSDNSPRPLQLVIICKRESIACTPLISYEKSEQRAPLSANLLANEQHLNRAQARPTPLRQKNYYIDGLVHT